MSYSVLNLQAEKEEQATKEVVAAPLKPDAGEFTAQSAEVWKNDMARTDSATGCWADDKPIPQPVPVVPTAGAYAASNNDWNDLVSMNILQLIEEKYVKRKEIERHLPGYYSQTSLECTDDNQKR